MLILALSIFVLPIGENAADVQIMFDLLEDVVVFDKSFNRGNSKDSRVLTISRFGFVVLDDVVCNEGHSLIRHIEFANINRVSQCRIVPVKIAFHRLYVLNMETEDIVIEDSILDQIVMQTFPKQHFGGLRDLALRLSVHFKTGRTGKAKELRFLEMPNNILVHISELAAVAFVNDEDNLFVTVCVHYLFVLRTLNGICHLLHCRDNELPVFILHLPHKNVCAICDINRASLKLVKLFGCLRVQVLTVNKEDNLLDIRISCENLSSLKGCQRLSCAGGMPDISIAICERSLSYKGFYGIHLIGAHNHQNLIRIVQNGIACQHLDDVIPCQKRD